MKYSLICVLLDCTCFYLLTRLMVVHIASLESILFGGALILFTHVKFARDCVMTEIFRF